MPLIIRSSCGDTLESDFRKGQLVSSRITLKRSLDLILQSKRNRCEFINTIKLNEAINICIN